MAVLRFPEEDQKIDSEPEIRAELAALGIDYERWSLDRVWRGCSAEAVLAAYADEIEEMKRRGGYVTADVIDVNPETPNLEAMLAKFDKEHTHDEDEVRFILAGRGIFFLHSVARLSRSKSVRATCCACRAARRTGSRSAKIAASAPFAGSRTRRAGRRTTPAPAWTGLPAAVLRSGVSRAARSHWHSPMTKPQDRRSCFLLDVEGTVAPISLVYDQLFPYARAHFREFLQEALRRPWRCARS